MEPDSKYDHYDSGFDVSNSATKKLHLAPGTAVTFSD